MLDKRKFYINGEWVNPYKENDCEVINPCNEEPFATISLGSKEDTDLTVKAAKTAFESWKETTKEERIDYLKNYSQFIKKDLVKWLRLFH
jgi:aldehyde dehydrogenase (NAD+)